MTFGDARLRYESVKMKRDSMLDAVKELRGNKHGDNMADMEKDERPSVQMLLESYRGFNRQLEKIDALHVIDERVPREETGL